MVLQAQTNDLYNKSNYHFSLLGESCPPPANPPHGTWTCGEQEIPIPGATSILDGEYTTFKGKWKHYLQFGKP